MEIISNSSSLTYQRSNMIPISCPSPTLSTNNSVHYKLNEGCFDPSKHSPPNSFMTKLQSRLNQSLGKNNINWDKE